MRASSRRRARRPAGAVNSGVVLANAESMMDDPNVLGYFVGRKTVAGSRTRQLSLVMLVAEKIPVRKLEARRRLPRCLTLQPTSRRQRELPLDVIEMPAPFARAAAPLIGPGDSVIPPLGGPGSVGLVVRVRSTGRMFVTTAGHVVQRAGVGGQVQLSTRGPAGAMTVSGVVHSLMLNDRADFALVEPDGGCPSRNAYQDRLTLGVPAVPTQRDIGKQLQVLTPTSAKPTRFRGLFASVPMGSGRLVNALLTDLVTVGGDSGSVLVDSGFRPWGMLVGFSTSGGIDVSAFMPVDIPLVLAEADML